jgi:hypothetical protein
MFIAYQQNAGQNIKKMIGNKSVENLTNLTMLINQSCIQKAMKSKLNSANDCYHSVQNRLFKSLKYTKQ